VSTLLIPDSAINRFARVATMEHTGINERRQVIPIPMPYQSDDYEALAGYTDRG